MIYLIKKQLRCFFKKKTLLLSDVPISDLKKLTIQLRLNLLCIL